MIGEDVLFDTFGDPGVLLNNIRKFDVDLAKIKHIVLSHDDWDHMAGLWYLIPNREDITVYVCPHFSQEIKDRIRSYKVKIVEVKEFTEITKGIYSTGEMVGNSDKRTIYEQSLILQSPKGIVIVTGCAHQGIINIVEKAKSRFKDKIYLLMGGMHLKDLTRKEVDGIVLRFNSYGIENIAPMHCTGKRAINSIREVFGHAFMQVRVGSNIEI